ncbi:MAG TPA: hypothetical protein VF906_04145 [Candidatus Bathyarchaeia archaeon]
MPLAEGEEWEDERKRRERLAALDRAQKVPKFVQYKDRLKQWNVEQRKPNSFRNNVKGGLSSFVSEFFGWGPKTNKKAKIAPVGSPYATRSVGDQPLAWTIPKEKKKKGR